MHTKLERYRVILAFDITFRDYLWKKKNTGTSEYAGNI